MRDGLVIDNSAEELGGAIALMQTNGLSSVMQCDFISNSGYGGGAIALTDSAMIDSCRFEYESNRSPRHTRTQSLIGRVFVQAQLQQGVGMGRWSVPVEACEPHRHELPLYQLFEQQHRRLDCCVTGRGRQFHELHSAQLAKCQFRWQHLVG